MPIRPTSAGKKGKSAAGKKGKTKKGAKEETIDPRQEQIDGLIREREEIRSKLNSVCAKIIEHIDVNDHQTNTEWSKQQPADLSLESLYEMIDEICYYRVAFLNLFQEIDDSEKIPVQKKVTQLCKDEPDLFRRPLVSSQRLSFVIRERDLWKENAHLLQIMYATIVDQLEMGLFSKVTRKTHDVLHSHRLNLEDVCRIFSAPRIRSIHDAEQLRTKPPLDQSTNASKDQQTVGNANQRETLHLDSSSSSFEPNSSPGHHAPPATVVKRSVSFADQVNIIEKKDNDDDETATEDDQTVRINLQRQRVTNSPQEIESPPSTDRVPSPPQRSTSRLPPARETLVEQMDSNLRMLIIKELSKNARSPRPPSRMSSIYTRQSNSYSPPFDGNRSFEWVELARLVGINESEIEHWLSQGLQYPAGRVISTWCNSSSSPPTVAELHQLIASRELHRLDLARYIETMYAL